MTWSFGPLAKDHKEILIYKNLGSSSILDTPDGKRTYSVPPFIGQEG
jgi:hypothetical protein